MNQYVLDACALIALLRDEIGANKVNAIINAAYNGSAVIVMNKLNLLEVYYDSYRLYGKTQADIIITKFKKLPVSVNSEITDKLFAEAGRLKATYKISLADAIALAEASVQDRIIVTADHHEFDIIEQHEKINFLWIR
ncbi:MAG: PIN domain-containing protein [Planctomycetaceae bacterium]|jgi:PIN domain nuclease of toxin-antitoxin system|nr:PIN domain-containing protein [Planctomycetaceae bacterium]